MKKYTTTVEAFQWDGKNTHGILRPFKDAPCGVCECGEPWSKHGKLTIFFNGKAQYEDAVCVGSYVVIRGYRDYVVMSEAEFKKKYKEADISIKPQEKASYDTKPPRRSEEIRRLAEALYVDAINRDSTTHIARFLARRAIRRAELFVGTWNDD